MASSWLLPRVVELAATYVVQSTLDVNCDIVT